MKLLTLAALSVALGFSQSTDCNTGEKCQEAVKTNRRSSILHFRIGEFYFQKGNMDKPGSPNCTSATGTNQEVNRERGLTWIYPLTIVGCNSKYYQSAANEFREVLIGELKPEGPTSGRTSTWARFTTSPVSARER